MDVMLRGCARWIASRYSYFPHASYKQFLLSSCCVIVLFYLYFSLKFSSIPCAEIHTTPFSAGLLMSGVFFPCLFWILF